MQARQIITLSILAISFISSGILFSQSDFGGTMAAAITGTLTPADECLYALNETSMSNITRGNSNITSVRINDDNTTDYIIEKISPEFCGSTGCIFELCVVEKGKGRIMPFGLVAEKIVIKETLTNQMHDIQLTGKSTTNLVWDTERYIVTH